MRLRSGVDVVFIGECLFYGLLVLEHPLMSKRLEVPFFVLTVFEALSMLARRTQAGDGLA